MNEIIIDIPLGDDAIRSSSPDIGVTHQTPQSRKFSPPDPNAPLVEQVRASLKQGYIPQSVLNMGFDFGRIDENYIHLGSLTDDQLSGLRTTLLQALQTDGVRTELASIRSEGRARCDRQKRVQMGLAAVFFAVATYAFVKDNNLAAGLSVLVGAASGVSAVFNARQRAKSEPTRASDAMVLKGGQRRIITAMQEAVCAVLNSRAQTIPAHVAR